MPRPQITFRDGVKHYQTTPNRAWMNPVSYTVALGGWATVTYEDGAVVSYPPTAIDMIIDFPATER